MDLKRMHMDSGLLRAQAKRNFDFGSDADSAESANNQDLGDKY
jgi:hypothetical protein